MNPLIGFVVGYLAGLVGTGIGGFLALGGMIFAVQGVPVERWWFGLFDWTFGVFNGSPGAFAIGFLFGISTTNAKHYASSD